LDENLIGKWYRNPEEAETGMAVPAYEFTENCTLVINGEDVHTTWEIHNGKLVLTTLGDKEKPIPIKIERFELLTLNIPCGLTAGIYYKKPNKE
jgi:hypothetical protein